MNIKRILEYDNKIKEHVIKDLYGHKSKELSTMIEIDGYWYHTYEVEESIQDYLDDKHSEPERDIDFEYDLKKGN